MENPTPAYNPLAEPVLEKSYSNGPLPIGGQAPERVIPEATFTPPPPDMQTIPQRESTKADQKPAQPKPPFNPDIAQLSDPDKNAAAGHLATTVVNMYEMLTNLGNRMLVIPERKLRKMQMEGEIDMTVPVPYTKTQFIPLSEFIDEYNTTAADTMTVDDEFKKEVVPLLTEVLQKRGHGMTTEQKLLFLFCSHAGQNGFRFFEMRAQSKQILDFAKEESINRRSRPLAPVVPMSQIRAEESQQNQPPSMQGSPGEQMPATPVQAQTLQERIMQEHTAKMHGDQSNGMGVNVNPGTPGINTETGLPKFGDQSVLTTIEKLQADEVKQKLKAEKNRRILDGRLPAKKRIPTKSKKTGVVPGPVVKKSPGRPRKDA